MGDEVKSLADQAEDAIGRFEARYAGIQSEEAVEALTACLIISELLGCNKSANNTIEAMVKINRASLICTCRPPFIAPPSKGSGKRLKSIEETRKLSLSAPVDMTQFNMQPDIDVPVKRRVPPIAGIYEAGIGIRRGSKNRD